MKPKISIITLGVSDLTRSVAFYKDGLGFPLHTMSGDDVVFFELDGTWLALYPREKLAEDAGVDPVGSGFVGITIAHNEPDKQGVDTVIEKARVAGAHIQKEPRDVFWGGYSGYFKDPDGYLWEVAWNPFADLS